MEYAASSCSFALPDRPEVGITPGAQQLSEDADVELKKELHRSLTRMMFVRVCMSIRLWSAHGRAKYLF